MEYAVSTQIEIRFADVDSMGHVNNAKYFTYMEQARMAYFKKLGLLDFTQLELPPKESVILASIQCDFKSPAHLGESLEVRIRVAKLGNSSFEMEYEILETNSERLVAIGKSSQVYFDYQTQKSRPLSPEIRKRIGQLEGKSFD